MQAYPVPSSDKVTKPTTTTPKGPTTLPSSEEANWVPIIENMVILHKELKTDEMETEEKEWWADQEWFEDSISKEDFSYQYNEVSKFIYSFKYHFEWSK